MIINMTGGAGGGLDFKVVQYTATPTGTAKENTIGVVTNTAITGWVMQAEQPSAASGKVWVEVATASDVAFYADKKQTVKLYPKQVMQYTNGAWSRCEAYTFQSGGWVQFSKTILPLYWDGVEDSITGGFTVTNGSKEATYTNTRITGAGEGRVYTNSKIDVSSFSTLIAEVSSPESSTPEINVGLREDYSSGKNFTAVETVNVASGETKQIALSIDHNAVTKPLYVVVSSKSVAARWWLHKLWLE